MLWQCMVHAAKHWCCKTALRCVWVGVCVVVVGHASCLFFCSHGVKEIIYQCIPRSNNKHHHVPMQPVCCSPASCDQFQHQHQSLARQGPAAVDPPSVLRQQHVDAVCFMCAPASVEQRCVCVARFSSMLLYDDPTYDPQQCLNNFVISTFFHTKQDGCMHTAQGWQVPS